MSYVAMGRAAMSAFGRDLTPEEKACDYLGGVYFMGECRMPVEVRPDLPVPPSSCTSNAQCPSGYVCHDGRCAELVDESIADIVDPNCRGVVCPPSKVCVKGVCKEGTPVDCKNYNGLEIEDQLICKTSGNACFNDPDCLGSPLGDRCFLGQGSPGYCFQSCDRDPCSCRGESPDHGCNPQDGLCYTLGDIAKEFSCPPNAQFRLGADCLFKCQCNPGYHQAGGACVKTTPRQPQPPPPTPGTEPPPIVPIKKAGANWVLIAAIGAGVVSVGAAVYLKRKKAAGAGSLASF